LAVNDEYVVEILEGVGLIAAHEGRAALEQARREDRDIIDVLAERGHSKQDILKALANQFGMETISLRGLDIPQEVLDQVPGEVARRYKIIPVYKTDNTLTVAISDPFDVETLDSLRYILKCNVEGVVAPAEEIDVALNQYEKVRSPVVSLIRRCMSPG